jgi:hypothetical protein
MRLRFTTRPLCALALVLFTLSTVAHTEAAVTCSPSNQAVCVNPDTPLVLTFSGPPTLGNLRCG